MEHPPIPPNCKYFVEDEDGVWFVHWDNMPTGTRSRTLISALTLWDKGIVSAVARCAWFDYILTNQGNINDRLLAMRNCDAWADWGRA